MNEKNPRLCGGLLTHDHASVQKLSSFKIGEKEITTPAGKGRRYAITFGERKKKKKIASADDDMLECHRLSRKKFPQWLSRTLEKTSNFGTILHLHLHLHYSRRIDGLATPQKLGKGAGAIPILYRYYHVSCM